MIITNAAPDTYDVVERVTEAGREVTGSTRPLALAFPPGIFSLSRCRLHRFR